MASFEPLFGTLNGLNQTRIRHYDQKFRPLYTTVRKCCFSRVQGLIKLQVP